MEQAAPGRHMLVGDVHLLLINSAGEVLFGRRQNTGYRDGAWHLPSGHLEAGESLVTALIREAREELGWLSMIRKSGSATSCTPRQAAAAWPSSSPSMTG